MADLITLEGYSGRSEGVRFDLVSPGLAKIGELHPAEVSVPKIENNINRAVKRTLTGLHLAPEDTNAINPFRDRVRPVWLIANPDTGQLDEYPLGVFSYANVSRRRERYHADTGIEADANLVDMLVAFDQPIERSMTWPAGYAIDAIIAQLAMQVGIFQWEIEATGKTLGSPVSYIAGRDTRLKALNEVASLAAFYSPWFDNEGVLRAETVPEVGGAPARFNYDEPPTIYLGSVVDTDDLLEAPNRYVVIDTAATEGPISGFYDVPGSAPHSIANRGYPFPKVIEVQGLASPQAAYDTARAAALQDASTFRWAEVQSIVNPLHDTYDVVQFDQELWREQAWRLDCQPGGPMWHSWRRTYREAFA